MTTWQASHKSSCIRQAGIRSGLTMLEMLLVLAIVVIVGAMAVPNLRDAYQTHDLKKSAEFVRKHIADGRRRAIETGLVYQFRYEPGQQRFVIIPDAVEADDQPTNSQKYFRFAGAISPTIQFRADPQSVAVSGEHLDAKRFEGMPDAHELSQATWSEPVEFHFEGSAVDSEVYLVDAENRYIKLSIRGLTGGVRVGEISWEYTQ